MCRTLPLALLGVKPFLSTYIWRPIQMVEEETRRTMGTTDPWDATCKICHIPFFGQAENELTYTELSEKHIHGNNGTGGLIFNVQNIFSMKIEPGMLTEKSWAESFLEKFVPFCREVKNPSLEEVHIITDFSSSSSYSALMKVFIEFADKLNKTSSDQKGKQPRLPLSNVYMTYDYAQDSLSGQGYKSNIEKSDTGDSCTICLYPKADPKCLPCGHSFCSECFDQMLKYKPRCAICGKIMGTLTGDQPNDGRMCVKTSSMNLAGYEGYGCIEITYDFPIGKQGADHPSPGKWYSQMTRIAYLPNTPEGRMVCRMLQLAFKRRLVFTVCTLQTTGIEGLTWNDIYHKTNPIPGTQNGYPDQEYLSRVKDELAAKGITEDDLAKEESTV